MNSTFKRSFAHGSDARRRAQDARKLAKLNGQRNALLRQFNKIASQHATTGRSGATSTLQGGKGPKRPDRT